MKITLNSVSFKYEEKANKKLIFDDLNATFESGKFYAITGPSGSGKTTLLALINKIYLPNSGEILIDDVDIKKIKSSTHRKENVSTIYQSYNLIPHFNAYENIELDLDIKGIKVKNRKEYIYDILEKVGLNEYDIENSVEYLSGGEQQRVAVARSLASSTKFILADEPTGNLDSTLSKSIIQILKKLTKENNIGVIMVTHSRENLKIADVVYEIRDHKLFKRGN